MRIFCFIAVLGALLSLGACENKGITTEHGFRFINHTKKGGATPKPGEAVLINTYTYLGDSLMASTIKNFGGPREFPLPKPEELGERIPPIYDAVLLMSAGDSATVYQPIDSFLQSVIPAELRKDNKEIRYEVVLISIKSAEEMAKAQEEEKQKAAVVAARGAAVKATVDSVMNAYKTKKLGASLQKSASGLEYVLLQPGTPGLKEGDQVMTHYYGVLKSNGEMFDNSFDRGAPAPFTVGQLIPGFNEGMSLIGKGGKGVLFIPYQLAYGEQENGPIPAKSDLVFYLEME